MSFYSNKIRIKYVVLCRQNISYAYFAWGCLDAYESENPVSIGSLSLQSNLTYF